VAAKEITLAEARRPPPPVSFAAALRFWLKLGFISFGGPTGQIAIMHQELVERRGWISERRFLHALNYCMLLPGPEAQQLATYIGWLMHGARGGVVAGGLFVLPSFFILIGLSWIYMAWGRTPAVAGILYGIKPAVVAIVAFAAYRIGSRALNDALLWMIAAAAFIAIRMFDVPFPYIVIGAGLAGHIGGRIAPSKFQASNPAHAAAASSDSALIDDHTTQAEHTRFKWARVAWYAALGTTLWLLAEAALFILFGWRGLLTQMGWFFTKAAFVTFGGAYAVLPYVQQAAVEHYGWLTPGQMIDGMALGETTPGPLIMVVTFMGFVGAWAHAPLGPDALALAGIAGAAVATWFTFQPSFIFILVGAPLVEATRGDIKFTAPMTGITAAVVGVILNLAVYFAGHVLWPAGFNGGFDAFAAAIAIAALVALARFQVNVIVVILACALAGMVHSLFAG
jgi:chromate transporter